MTRYVILDTGPLVASLNPTDSFHTWAKEQMRNTSAAFLTCEAVIAEAAYFLSRDRLAMGVVLDFVNLAPVQVPFHYTEHRAEIRKLIAEYADVPMSFADACLVRISELYPDAPILTLDSDFLIYRRNKNERLPVLLPEEQVP